MAAEQTPDAKIFILLHTQTPIILEKGEFVRALLTSREFMFEEFRNSGLTNKA